MQQAGRDVYIATKSVNQLSFLTFRPLFLLLWWLSHLLFRVAKFLFRHLFQGLYLSFLKGLQQSKLVGRKLVHWQYSLTPNQLKVEGSIVLLLVLLYLLRRHIQKQLYVQRVTRWYRVKQQRTIKVRDDYYFYTVCWSIHCDYYSIRSIDNNMLQSTVM
jgi:hypothetical protein